MPRRPSVPLAAANPFVLWSQLALQWGEMLFASSQVINHRVTRMHQAGANPSARDRREFTLMGTEKLQAAARSAAAVGTRLPALMLAAPPQGWAAGMQLWSQWLRLGSSALTPVHAAATANARRLAALPPQRRQAPPKALRTKGRR